MTSFVSLNGPSSTRVLPPSARRTRPSWSFSLLPPVNLPLSRSFAAQAEYFSMMPCISWGAMPGSLPGPP